MTVGRAKLIDKPLRAIGLLHYALLVVLPNGPAQFIIVHLWLVLPLAPQLGHSHRVLDLEHALLLVQPPNHGRVRATCLHLLQQLLQKLPQVDGRRAVRGRPAAREPARGHSIVDLRLHLDLLELRVLLDLLDLLL